MPEIQTAVSSRREITLKAILISFVLTIILAASNAYLGLKVGTTIAASIPAVVIALGVFRLFRQYDILEVNIVQSAASTGEGVTAGLIFTVPALIIMHFWMQFNYWETALIGMTGGVLGVLFSIPLRRALLEDTTLKFPEGTAIGQVMKASDNGGTSVKYIAIGSVVSGIIGLCQTGFHVLAEGYEFWMIKGRMIFGFDLGFSSAVLAAGYICGINVGMSILVGVILGWVLGVPILSLVHPVHLAGSMTAADAAVGLWSNYIRYIGVGTMLCGGLWTLLKLFRPVIAAVLASLEALHLKRSGELGAIAVEDHDITINWFFWGLFVFGVITFVALQFLFRPALLGISWTWYISVLLGCAIYLIFLGFVFSSVSGYFAGLVGATNSPGSGLLVSSLLLLSFLLLMVLNPLIHFNLHPDKGMIVAALAVMICSFMGAAMVMTNESIQVAKASQIIGGTPWKQQVVLMCSVVVAALVIPFILQLLFNAYGIGGVFPHAGMSSHDMLSAPQAGLMAAVAQGVFSSHLPWLMVFVGIGIAIICIMADSLLRFFWGIPLPVLAVGLGIYLPLSASVPIIFGGILSYIIQRRVHAKHGIILEDHEAHTSPGLQNALLLACGLVAGETLMGVVLAIPFAITQSTDVLRLVPNTALVTQISGGLSILVTIGLCTWIYRVATREK